MIELVNTIHLGKASPSIGGGSAKPKYVPELPETGEEGVLYLIPTEVTRDGYQIFQEFTWYNNEWKAIGAYDVGIDATNIVYQQSFDSSTGTWTVKVG